MDAKLITDAITLLVVINPIGGLTHFITLTAGMDKRERLRVARRACTVAGVILLSFIAVGEVVLDGLGVKITSFRAAGGLILLLIALRMVLSVEAKHPYAAEKGADIAVFPLGTPFLAGPGAITAAVLLTENGKFGIQDQFVTASVLVLILALTFGIFTVAASAQRKFGMSGAAILSRVLGLVLAALAVQTMLEGLRPFIESLK